ncbi:PTS sugar transporter subunit IIA, partial [Collinsella tanakaei]|uniref:PTS sugar transporter subunit IIA n=2 Tax=Collinsella TaxID=102106 RepID=UPI00248EBA34
EAFVENFKKTIEDMSAEDEIVLMGDIQGGSPLTNAMNEIASAGMLPSTIVFAGMNLPMAMTALMSLGSGDLQELRSRLVDESRMGITEIVLAYDEDEEDL